MTDKTILKLITYFHKEGMNQVYGRANRGNVEYAIRTDMRTKLRKASAQAKAEKKTDIYLMTLSQNELTELRTAIKIGRYIDSGSSLIKDRKAPALTDLKAWQLRLDVPVKNMEAAVQDVRSRGAFTNMESLIDYLDEKYKGNALRRNMYRIYLNKHGIIAFNH